VATIISQSGEAIPLALVLEDGDSSKYPQAVIYDRSGTSIPISTINLVFVADGYYYGSFVVPSSSKYEVVYKVFLDSARTMLDPDHYLSQDLIISDQSGSASSGADEAQLNVSYDDDTRTFGAMAWMDRNGQTVVSPTSATIWVRDQNDVLLLTQSSTTPYPNGIFLFQKVPFTLIDNRIYHVDVTVTDSLGTVTTVQTFTTIG